MIELNTETLLKLRGMLEKYEAEISKVIGFAAKLSVSEVPKDGGVPQINNAIVIINVVASHYDVKRDVLLSDLKSDPLPDARRHAWALTKEFSPKRSLALIGAPYSGRKYCTVSAALKKHRFLLKHEKEYAAEYQALRAAVINELSNHKSHQ